MSGSVAPRFSKAMRPCIHRIRFRAVRLQSSADRFHWTGKCLYCPYLEILTRQDFAAIHAQFARWDTEVSEWLKAGGRGQPPLGTIGTPNHREPARPSAKRIA